MAPVSSYVTRLLDPDTWDDFAHLVEANNGVWGGCWCMGFHPEGVGKGHTAAGSRRAKQAHVGNGTVHQILVCDGDECVGWCQFGTPVELPNINNRKAYAKDLGEMPDWRIGCIFTGSRHRRNGVRGQPSARRWPPSAMPEVGSSRHTLSKSRGALPSGERISTRARTTCSRSSASSESE
jgi:hypothetical protein